MTRMQKQRLRILIKLLVLAPLLAGPHWLDAHLCLPGSELCPGAMGGHFFKQLPWLVAVVVGGAAGTEQLPPLPTLASSGDRQRPCLLVLSWGCIWKEFCAARPPCSPGGAGPGQWVGEKRGGPLPGWRHTSPSTHPLGAGCPFPLPSPAATAFLA